MVGGALGLGRRLRLLEADYLRLLPPPPPRRRPRPERLQVRWADEPGPPGAEAGPSGEPAGRSGVIVLCVRVVPDRAVDGP